MNLDKDTVRYLNMQPCFACKYSQIDPFDWGLRCCNGDSTFCTEYCPGKRCDLYEQRNMERLRFVNDPFENEPTFETCKTFFVNDDISLLNALGYTLMRLKKHEPSVCCFSKFFQKIQNAVRDADKEKKSEED